MSTMSVASMPSESIELIVLTGFLGSGKTTLLAAFLRQPQIVDTAVIVNEIGEIDLDAAVLITTAPKVPMALLSNGCVCCTMGGDLCGTIAALIEERITRGLPPLVRVVLETTGLTRPGPILRSLAPLAARLRVHVVCTFACGKGLAALDLPEAAAQIAGAQRIVLTWQDVAGADAVEDACALLARVNPLADIVTVMAAGPRALAALAPPVAGRTLRNLSLASVATHDHGQALHSDIRSALCVFGSRVTHDELAEWLDNLAGLCGDRLLRVKGLVRVEGQPWPLLVQGVGTLFSPLVPLKVDEEHATGSFLVLIVRGMQLNELHDLTPALPMTIKPTARLQPLPVAPVGSPATVPAEAGA